MIGYEFWSMFCKIESYVRTAPKTTKQQITKLEDILKWTKLYFNILDNHGFCHKEELPDLFRGDVILVELGENIGKEFSGQHPAIVLRDCPSNIEQVFILPITSKKPKAYNPNKKSIYLEIKKISGLRGYQHPTDRTDPDNYKHWCNILNVRNISKNRIVYPPKTHKLDGKYLNIISAMLEREIVIKKNH